jgi:hypothetical protein
MLNRLVTQVTLDGARIDAVIRQLVATAMPQHVWMNLHIEARRLRRTLDHGLKATIREWRATLADEYKRRFGYLLALLPATSSGPPSASGGAPILLVSGSTQITVSVDIVHKQPIRWKS